MLQLLSPLGLLALAALAIPAVLHLWRPPPSVVRVGTLRFFTGPAVRRLTKLRWRERLLLALRLLLLACLALLLAQPIFRKAPPNKPQRWALLEAGVVPDGDALKRWRELDRDGFETRTLARGFQVTSPGANGEASSLSPPDVWSLLREVDARLPPGSTVAVFASDRIASLAGERPVMRHCSVEWIAGSGQTPVNAWIDTVTAVRGDASKVRVAVARSDALRTESTAVLVPRAAGRTPLAHPLDGSFIEVGQQEGDELAARLLRDRDDASPGPWVSISTRKPLTLAILHAADRAEDARYLRAAVLALAETLGREMSVGNEIGPADSIFWLNDQPAPAEVMNEVESRGVTLLTDAENSREAHVAIASSMHSEGLQERVDLFRRVPPISHSGAAVWTDGFGAPLLSMTQVGAGLHWRFFSRFHPDWNDLPRSSALAAALRPLLFPQRDSNRSTQADVRRVGRDQGAPAEAAEGNTLETPPQLSPPPELVDLHTLLWFLCVALFAVERTLSHLNATPARQHSAPAEPKPEPAFAGQA